MRVARVVAAFVLVSVGILLAVLGGTDINLITGAETHPNVTQHDSAVWGHGDTVVVVYRDGREGPTNRCGISVSTDGGATFTRITPSPFTGGCTGNPSVLYSVRAAKWFFSANGGGCALGQWESPDGINWVSSGCIATAGALENHSTWVDNNPGSPNFGRQYAAFNDFAGEGRPKSTYSTDDGVTWSLPAILTGTFRRVVKMTGSLGTDGTVFVQTVYEQQLGLGSRKTLYLHRSAQGGSYEEIIQGESQNFFNASYFGPGRVDCSDSAGKGCMYAPGFWWDEGWGQPGVGPNSVVHYVFSAFPEPDINSDPGNIYYIRSTNNGTGWSLRTQLNTDAPGRLQWGPSLAVNAQGILVVSWYDERNTVGNSLERYARVSFDNGLTWGPEMPLSDVTFPVPTQPDPSFTSTHVGQFNHAMFSDDGYGGNAYITWVDGRVSINGSPQQDIFFDKIPLVPPTVFVVTTIDDHDDTACTVADCTLREAINAANSNPGADIIRFASGVTGTIQLGSTLPNLSTNITLEGPGANLLTIRRNTAADYRILGATNGTSNGPTVNISDLSVANGQAQSAVFPANCGGGIYNGRGKLTLTNVAISGSNAFYGGGVCSETGATGTAFLTMRNCTVNGNSAPGNFGGGVYVGGSSGAGATTSLQNCTFNGNTAMGGGGIFNFASSSGKASLSVLNCTFNGNDATNGGAIFNDKDGAGIATLTLGNSIFKKGLASNLINDGTVTSQGHNLSDDAAGGNGTTAPGGLLNGPSDLRNTNPLLDTLKDNGGQTMTHALLPGSPAINSGDDALTPSIDQRGYMRAALSDRGSFESDGIPLRIISIARSSADIVITFQAVAGRVFRLERKLVLPPTPTFSTWENISGVPDLTAGATGPAQITDPGGASSGKALYRVRLLP